MPTRPLAIDVPLPITLGGMPIPRLAADVGFVDLDRSEHQAVLPVGQRGTDTMTSLPRGFLNDRGRALYSLPLQTGQHPIDRGDPDPTTQRRTMRDRAGFHRKETAAVMTPVRLTSTILACRDMC